MEFKPAYKTLKNTIRTKLFTRLCVVIPSYIITTFLLVRNSFTFIFPHYLQSLIFFCFYIFVWYLHFPFSSSIFMYWHVSRLRTRVGAWCNGHRNGFWENVLWEKSIQDILDVSFSSRKCRTPFLVPISPHTFPLYHRAGSPLVRTTRTCIWRGWRHLDRRLVVLNNKR